MHPQKGVIPDAGQNSAPISMPKQLQEQDATHQEHECKNYGRYFACYSIGFIIVLFARQKRGGQDTPQDTTR